MNYRIKTAGDASFYAAHIRFGCCDVMLAREQQRDIHRHACKNGLFNRRNTCASAWNLDENIGTVCSRMKLNRRFYGAGRIVGQQRRYFQRYPAINPASGIMNRTKEVGRLG